MINHTSLRAAVCLLVFFALPGFGQSKDTRWISVSDGERSFYFYAPERVARSGAGRLSVWIKTVDRRVDGKPVDAEHPNDAGPDDARKQTTELWEFDCGDRRERLLQQTTYKPNGESFNTLPGSNPKWHHVAPDTIADEILEAACRPAALPGFGQSKDKRWSIASGSKQYLFFYTPASVIRSGPGRLRTWVKQVERRPDEEPPHPNESVDSRDAGHKYSVELWELDCANRRMRVFQRTSYGQSGEILEKLVDEDAERYWEYVTPATVGEAVFDVICRRHDTNPKRSPK
jgi:hypothetical protein